MDDPFDAEAFHKAHHNPEAAPQAAAAAAPAPAVAPVAGTASGRIAIAPAARALAKKLDLDPADVPGTGPGGRITKEDVATYAERRKHLVAVPSGASLEVPRQGKGAPILVLPGFGTDLGAFARQVPLLAERFEAIGVHPRGVGLSEAPEADAYDLGEAADDVASLVGDPAHVVGASLGAAVAIEFALRHPTLVRSLTLLTPFVEARARLLAVLDLWAAAAATGAPDLVASATLPWLFAESTLADPRARDRVHRGLADIAGRVDPASLPRWARGIAAWSGSRAGDLDSIAVPTLVVAGAQDLLTPGAESLAAEIPAAKCVVVSGAGHAVALEAADAVNEALVQHLIGV